MNTRLPVLLIALFLSNFCNVSPADAADGATLEEEISKARQQLAEAESRLLPEARAAFEKTAQATRDRLRTEEATRLGRAAYFARQMQEAMVWTNVARVKELLTEEPPLANGRAPARTMRVPKPGETLPPPAWFSPNDDWLSAAASMGSSALVSLLISHGAALNPPEYTRHDSPLHRAVRKGHKEVTALLLKAGAKVDAAGGNSESPLMAAVGRQLWSLRALGGVAPDHERARMEVVGMLLDHGADLLATNIWSDGRSSFDVVLATDRTDWLDVMLAHTRLPSRPLRDGDTLLHIAARYGRVTTFARLAELGIDVKATNHAGLTAWHEWVVKSRLTEDALNLSDPPEPSGYYPVLALRAPLDAYILAALGDTNRLTAAMAADPALLNRPGPRGRHLLHWAAECGRSSSVILLLQRGAEVSAADPLGETPLHLAAQNGYPQVAARLLAAGAKLEARNQRGESPVSHAAAAGQLPVLEALLTRKPNLSAVGGPGSTPLHRAVAAGHLVIVRRLLDAGAALDARDENGRTPLHLAVSGQNLPLLELLLAHKPALDLRDATGTTPLELALTTKQQPLAAKLIASGAQAAPAAAGVTTPLHLAAQNGDVTLLRNLLAAGANVKTTNEAGVTAFFLAAANGHLPAADLLLLAGANINERDTNGATALHLARQYRHLLPGATVATNPAAFLKEFRQPSDGRDRDRAEIPPWLYLLAAGADASLTNVAGRTPLHSWARYGPVVSGGAGNPFSMLIAELIRAGAGVNARDTNGFTALHYAAGAGNPQFTDALVKARAGLEETNHLGQTPLHLAAATNPETVATLLAAGARISPADQVGDTPLHLAARDFYRREGIVRNLLRHGAAARVKNAKGETPVSLAQGFTGGLLPFQPTNAPMGLVETIRRGDVKAARILFEWDPQLADSSPAYGIRPLHWAAQAGDLEMVRLLVEFGANVNGHETATARGSVFPGQSPLGLAAMQGHKAVARFLLERGAEADLHTAARLGFVELFDRFNFRASGPPKHSTYSPLLIGGTTNQWDYRTDLPRWNEPPLLAAVRAGEYASAEFLLRIGAPPNDGDNFGHTPLYYATKSGRTNLVTLLENHHAKWDMFTLISLGDTNRLARLLSDTPAESDSVNEFLLRPLAWAVIEGELEAAKLLLANPAPLPDRLLAPAPVAKPGTPPLMIRWGIYRQTATPPETHNTLLHLAAIWDRVDIARVLLARGVSINAVNTNGHTALHLAAALGHQRFAKLLLEQGALPDYRHGLTLGKDPSVGATPLHLAAFCRQPELVKLLLAHGADRTATNRNGQTPLHNFPGFPACDIGRIVAVPGPAVRIPYSGFNLESFNKLQAARDEIMRLLAAPTITTKRATTP